MVENPVSKNSFKESVVTVAKLSIPVAVLAVVGVSASAGWISQMIATYEAEYMLGDLGLLGKIPVTDGFYSSKDGTEISFGLNIAQKDGASRHITVIFPKNKVLKNTDGNSKNNPAVKIAAKNVIEPMPLSISPFSLPHSEVKDIKNSDEIRLEGEVDIFLPAKKTLDNFTNLK